MSTSISPSSRSCATVVGWPLTKARDAPASVDHPAQQQRARIAAQLGVGSHCVEQRGVRSGELRADFGLCAPSRTMPGVAALAQSQRQRIDQDRLAGAGFAGQHGEAGAELELERVDDDEVTNGK